ncbi:MAG: DUF2510 domain-containing protein [Ilumatobacter sp.]
MRKSDAPPAGWYPDPQHRSRLRWWDGLDWTDIWRAPPSDAELQAADELARFFNENELQAPPIQSRSLANVASREDSQRIIEEIRTVARQEVDRATQQFSDRATNAVRSVTPLISEYGDQVRQWVRRAVILAIVLLAAYFVIQVIGQAAILDWVGDRIDNFTDDESGSRAVRIRPDQ